MSPCSRPPLFFEPGVVPIKGAARDRLAEDDLLWLTRLMAARDWTWVASNHDAGPVELGGSHRAETQIAGRAFRHITTV